MVFPVGRLFLSQRFHWSSFVRGDIFCCLQSNRKQEGTCRCWETNVGQEMYKLVLIQTLTEVGSILFVEGSHWLFNKVVSRYCETSSLAKLVGNVEFETSVNVLKLVYGQGLILFGVLFCPFLPAIGFMRNILVFYLRTVAVFVFDSPPQTFFRVASTHNFYMGILLVTVFISSLPVGFAMIEMTPSLRCGPFSVVIYYYASLANALKEVNKDLLLQLTVEQSETRKILAEQVASDRRAQIMENVAYQASMDSYQQEGSMPHNKPTSFPYSQSAQLVSTRYVKTLASQQAARLSSSDTYLSAENGRAPEPQSTKSQHSATAPPKSPIATAHSTGPFVGPEESKIEWSEPVMQSKKVTSHQQFHSSNKMPSFSSSEGSFSLSQYEAPYSTSQTTTASSLPKHKAQSTPSKARKKPSTSQSGKQTGQPKTSRQSSRSRGSTQSGNTTESQSEYGTESKYEALSQYGTESEYGTQPHYDTQSLYETQSHYDTQSQYGTESHYGIQSLYEGTPLSQSHYYTMPHPHSTATAQQQQHKKKSSNTKKKVETTPSTPSVTSISSKNPVLMCGNTPPLLPHPQSLLMPPRILPEPPYLVPHAQSLTATHHTSSII